MTFNTTDVTSSYQFSRQAPASSLVGTEDALVDAEIRCTNLTSTPADSKSSAHRLLDPGHPSNALVQASLITAQIFFGLGGIISALGLPACNPLAFALYREVAAGSILLVASTFLEAKGPQKRQPRIDWRRFSLLGLLLFGNQACVIVGIKLAGPVAAAVWQPSQPIMTATISMILGWEPLAVRRILGVLISFGGCATMVVLSSKAEHDEEADTDYGDTATHAPHASLSTQMVRLLVGHALFFMNCLCTSLYVLLSKKALRVYSPMKVTAWSYNIAAVFMAGTAYLTSLSQHTIDFLCPECTATWRIPTGAVLALLYAIIFNSVLAYFFITWSNQFATGTLVIGYSVLQPVTVALVTAVLLGIGVLPNCSSVAADIGEDQSENLNATADAYRCLDPPNAGTMLGMVGVFTGLAMVILTEPSKGGANGSQKYEKVVEHNESQPQLVGNLELT